MLARERKYWAEAQAKKRRTAKERDAVTRPVLTESIAMEFAKLTASGVPPFRAVEYFAASYCARVTAQDRRQWAQDLVKHPLVIHAQAILNGGEWHTLDRDRRLQIALDKHLAELARYLYTHTYEKVKGDQARKMDTAADRLLKHLADHAGEESTPWKAFVAEFLQKFEKQSANHTTEDVM
jgi:hypothetical protein